MLFIPLPSQAGKKLFPFTLGTATVVAPFTHNESRRPFCIQMVSQETALSMQGMDLAKLHSSVGNQISGMLGWGKEGRVTDVSMCQEGAVIYSRATYVKQINKFCLVPV